VYAELLGKKIAQHQVQVWLVNTGWNGGPYGVGQRMKLGYTRAMMSAALNGTLAKVPMSKDPLFGVQIPQTCRRFFAGCSPNRVRASSANPRLGEHPAKSHIR
jgi:ATP-dependent phosphoenolpyruvate carboxykinase